MLRCRSDYRAEHGLSHGRTALREMPIESALDMLCSEITWLLREYRLLFGFAVLTEVDSAVMLHSGAFLIVSFPAVLGTSGRGSSGF